VFDYFLKDHLGNVRMVLTTKSDTSQYAATMETAAAATENVLFTNIDNTRSAKPTGYPTDGTTNPNDYVARLNATNGQKIGPSIVLRVMAGDSIQLGAKAFYKSAAANTSSTPVSSMLAALLQSFSGAGISDGTHYATGSGSPLVTSFTSSSYDQLKQKDPSQNLTDKPKAYLNYVLFDDQFKLVDENSGVRQVQGSPDALQTLSTGKTVINKTGFLYIYTSNESGTDVFFDNLVVVHNSGPLLEETHYYPFGLGMAGISSSALKGMSYPENRKKYNGIELANKEFNDGSGVEMYEAYFRNLDPQIGRWWQIDLRPNYAFTPYASMDLNPIKNKDFYGDTTVPVNDLPNNWPVFNPETGQVQLNTVTVTANKNSNNRNTAAIPIGYPLPMESPLIKIRLVAIAVPNPILLTIALVLLPANYGPSSDHVPQGPIMVPNVPIPSAKDLPWIPGHSPGAGWVWKGNGTPESGRGNWINEDTGQKLHPDLNHPAPKGPHWGVKQPDGGMWDVFPDGRVEPNEK
jgi:hypothetical protein